ncbi:uncharacterized protein G2W53_031683 [Senna tora]|uniref:Uncharacterized protein n=1 Tax=Senna tora TaxID=362788 RepID=A0A834WHZ1_9FABA|nr:uncharacterized protein G2W53_031683 [Senna tora]
MVSSWNPTKGAGQVRTKASNDAGNDINHEGERNRDEGNEQKSKCTSVYYGWNWVLEAVVVVGVSMISGTDKKMDVDVRHEARIHCIYSGVHISVFSKLSGRNIILIVGRYNKPLKFPPPLYGH